MALQGHLRHPQRFITSHDAQGRAVIDKSVPPSAPFYEIKDALFAQCYVTNKFPVQLDHDADLDVYRSFLTNPPGLVVSGGTVLRYVDMPPGKTSPMHQTVSLDYGVVIEGEVELILDSGDRRTLQRGDICVQRATMHAWRNTSETSWARMLYILQPIDPISITGQQMKEDLGDMDGVRSSA